MKPRPDYKRHLKHIATAVDVDRISDRVILMDVHHNLVLVRHIIKTAGGGTISSLSPDGLQRAYFELRLLEVGARLTYERLQYLGTESPPPLYDISHNELEQLITCARLEGYNSATIQSILQLARPDFVTTEKQMLSGLDVTGMEVTYKQVLRLLVNPIKFIRAHPLDFHPLT